MSNDPSPLKYMGTQSHETMAMEAAMAQRAVHSTEQAADIAAEGTEISDATHWAIDKAKDTLRSAAGYVGERATTTLETYTGGSHQGDPDRRWHWCGVDGTGGDDGAVRSTDGETEHAEIAAVEPDSAHRGDMARLYECSAVKTSKPLLRVSKSLTRSRRHEAAFVLLERPLFPSVAEPRRCRAPQSRALSHRATTAPTRQSNRDPSGERPWARCRSAQPSQTASMRTTRLTIILSRVQRERLPP